MAPRAKAAKQNSGSSVISLKTSRQIAKRLPGSLRGKPLDLDGDENPLNQPRVALDLASNRSRSSRECEDIIKVTVCEAIRPYRSIWRPSRNRNPTSPFKAWQRVSAQLILSVQTVKQKYSAVRQTFKTKIQRAVNAKPNCDTWEAINKFIEQEKRNQNGSTLYLWQKLSWLARQMVEEFLANRVQAASQVTVESEVQDSGYLNQNGEQNEVAPSSPGLDGSSTDGPEATPVLKNAAPNQPQALDEPSDETASNAKSAVKAKKPRLSQPLFVAGTQEDYAPRFSLDIVKGELNDEYEEIEHTYLMRGPPIRLPSMQAV